MIKYVATDTTTGRTSLGIGLSAGNVQRLMEGRPIAIDGTKLGLPIDVLIH